MVTNTDVLRLIIAIVSLTNPTGSSFYIFLLSMMTMFTLITIIIIVFVSNQKRLFPGQIPSQTMGLTIMNTVSIRKKSETIDISFLKNWHQLHL